MYTIAIVIATLGGAYFAKKIYDKYHAFIEKLKNLERNEESHNRLMDVMDSVSEGEDLKDAIDKAIPKPKPEPEPRGQSCDATLKNTAKAEEIYQKHKGQSNDQFLKANNEYRSIFNNIFGSNSQVNIANGISGSNINIVQNNSAPAKAKKTTKPNRRGKAVNINVSGVNKVMYIREDVQKLTVKGTDCKVTCSGEVKHVVISGTDNTVHLNKGTKRLDLSGISNEVGFNGYIDDRNISGIDNHVKQYQ